MRRRADPHCVVSYKYQTDDEGLAFEVKPPASRTYLFYRCFTGPKILGMYEIFGCLLLLHFDGAGRCWVLSGGWVSGYGMMLCFGSFPLLVPSSRPFHFVLESFLLFVLLCLVAHIREPKADTIINKGQWAKYMRTGVLKALSERQAFRLESKAGAAFMTFG